MLGWDKVKPSPGTAILLLCSDCKQVDSTQLFDSTCDLSKLKYSSENCVLCGLLQDTLVRRGYKAPNIVTLRQNGAVVSVENGPDLLSIYVDPGKHTGALHDEVVPLTILTRFDYPKWCTARFAYTSNPRQSGTIHNSERMDTGL
jgi:hypothetical protein